MPVDAEMPMFIEIQLPNSLTYGRGRVPGCALGLPGAFEELWNLHPANPPELLIHGRRVKAPRWQQVYGHDYYFTGSRNPALPIPLLISGLLDWSRVAVNPLMNGVVVNWYDGKLGHYIGRHRDSSKQLIPGVPIVMISLGGTRILRLRQWRGPGKVDVEVRDQDVILLPYETNVKWTHEVPHRARCNDRRISVTLRAFQT